MKLFLTIVYAILASIALVHGHIIFAIFIIALMFLLRHGFSKMEELA